MEGKIYKICSENGDKIYIGSTTQKLCRRMSRHKADYKRWKEGIGNKATSYVLFDEYGVDNCNIVLLEDFSCETKQQLHEREAYYIRTMKCVNICIPLRTHKEWRQDHQEHMKAYKNANKEKLKEKQKEYYQANQEQIAIQQKVYKQVNKEHISIQKKKYYQENREKLKEQQKEYYQARKAKVSSQTV